MLSGAPERSLVLPSAPWCTLVLHSAHYNWLCLIIYLLNYLLTSYVIRRPSGARRVRTHALPRYSKFPIPDSLDSLDSLDSQVLWIRGFPILRFSGFLDSLILRPFVEAKESYRQGRIRSQIRAWCLYAWTILMGLYAITHTQCYTIV